MLKDKLISKLNIVSFFVVFATVWMIVMSILVPVSQTPDEYMHFSGMMKAFGTTEYIGEIENEMYSEAGLSDFNTAPDKRVDSEKYINAGMKKFDKTLKLSDFHLSLATIKYLPAAIGFYLGALIRLPKLICLQIAELFSCIFFIVLGAISLKLAPYKKEVFLFTLLMPMTIQQCSSINPDVIVISCSVLMTALILNMKHRDRKVTWKDIIILGLLLLAIYVAKMIYVPIILAVLIVPFDKFYLPIGKDKDLAPALRKYKWVILGLLIVLVGLFLFITRNDYFFKVLYACMLQPGRTLLIFKSTLAGLYYFYVQTFVGCFGWLDLFVSNLYIIIFFIMMFYINLFLKKNELDIYKKLRIRDRILMIVIAAAIFVLVFISMVSWSFELEGFSKNVDIATIRGQLYQISLMLGVQGRYFIPILPMTLISIGPGNELTNKKTYYGLQGAFYIYTIIYVIKMISFRYWG